jgi:hypothetical protein
VTVHRSVKQTPPSKRFQNVKGIEKNLTAELNAVLLYAFDYCFVGILEGRNKIVAVEQDNCE